MEGKAPVVVHSFEVLSWNLHVLRKGIGKRYLIICFYSFGYYFGDPKWTGKMGPPPPPPPPARIAKILSGGWDVFSISPPLQPKCIVCFSGHDKLCSIEHNGIWSPLQLLSTDRGCSVHNSWWTNVCFPVQLTCSCQALENKLNSG